MVKLIAVDMDGTFLSSKKEYDRERFQAIFQELKNRDIKFVVASGNQYAQLASFFPDIKDEITFVAENGVLVIEEGKLVRESHFETETVQNIICFIRANEPDVQIILSGIKSAYVESKVPTYFMDVAVFYCHALTVVEELLSIDLESDKFVKFALSVPDDRTEEIAELISQEFAGKARAVSSGRGFVDIIIPGKDKSDGLQFLAKKWQIETSEMMAFGDGNNDLEMLKLVEHSYAMANGAETVKETAKYAALSNNESGVLAVIEEFLANNYGVLYD